MPNSPGFDINYKIIGSRLKTCRKAVERTLKQMSALSGIPLSNISEMESGIKKPHPRYLAMLAATFGVNVNWVLLGKGPMLAPEFDTNLDFGSDTQRVNEMIYMMGKSDAVRFHVLGDFFTFKAQNKRLLKGLLPKKKDN